MKYKDFKTMSESEMKLIIGGNQVNPGGCGGGPAIYLCLGRWHMPTGGSAECASGTSSGSCGAIAPGWECCGTCYIECVTPGQE